MHDATCLERRLARYLERHPEDGGTVARFRELLRGDDGFLRRRTDPGHVTGSAWVVSPEGDAVLLTHHRKLDLWVQLGGHADGETDTLAVARREGTEESGIAPLECVDAVAADGTVVPFDLDIHEIPARKGEPAHLHFDVRHAFRAPHRDYVVSDESHDLAWVPLGEIRALTDDASVQRMLARWRARNPGR